LVAINYWELRITVVYKYNKCVGRKAYILLLFTLDRVFQYGVKVCMANFASPYMFVQRA